MIFDPDSGMIFVECEQGTEEWHRERAGVCTASTFSTAISVVERPSPGSGKKKGDPTAASDALAVELAIEQISKEPYGDTYETFAMRRGRKEEHFATLEYEVATNCIVEPQGFIVTPDRLFGYSTDGLVGRDGMIEVKVPLSTAKVISILETGNISEYIHQIQGGLWLTGRRWCDFVMRIPDLDCINNSLYVQRVWRDEDLIEDMEMRLLAFMAMVKRYRKLLESPLYDKEKYLLPQ